jgi:hypothetical protein
VLDHGCDGEDAAEPFVQGFLSQRSEAPSLPSRKRGLVTGAAAPGLTGDQQQRQGQDGQHDKAIDKLLQGA